MSSPFLSLDGLDGAGKSTQCRLLAEWLQARGHTVVQCHDPGGTPIGQDLREILLHHKGEMTATCEAFLFMASRAQLVAEVIRPALAAGHTVICDRFTLANLVYQGYAGGLDVERLRAMGQLATGGLEPDVTFVLDLPVELALARLKGDRDRMERRDAAFHEKVRAGFRAEAERQPGRIVVLDATREVGVVQEEICGHIMRMDGNG